MTSFLAFGERVRSSNGLHRSALEHPTGSSSGELLLTFDDGESALRLELDHNLSAMAHGPGRHAWLKSGPRLDERLAKMVKAGRLTDEDAARLRAAAESGQLEETAREIQLKHARARVSAAVEEGRLTEREARALVDRLEKGEDPRFLRGLRRGLRRRGVGADE